MESSKDISVKDKKTEILCPECGKRSYTKIRWGEISIHCKSCKSDFDVMIKLSQK